MLSIALVLASIFTLVAAQDDCADVIDRCYGGHVPHDGELPPGDNIGLSPSRQEWQLLCNASATAGPCLDNIVGSCESDAAVAKFAYRYLCLLEYQAAVTALQCYDTARGSESYASCVERENRDIAGSTLNIYRYCSHARGVMECANSSFERHCTSESAPVLGVLFTGSSIIRSKFALDSIQMDYTPCTILANEFTYVTPGVKPRPTIIGPISGGNGDPNFQPDQCFQQISACHGGIDPSTLTDESLPLVAREATFRTLCTTVAGAQACLSAVGASWECAPQVTLMTALFQYMCANTLTEFIDGNHCLSVSLASVQNPCEEPITPENGGNTADVLCRSAIDYLTCTNNQIYQACDRGANFAAGYSARHLAATASRYVHPDCSLLDVLTVTGSASTLSPGGNSGNGSSSALSPESDPSCEQLIGACYPNYALVDETLPATNTPSLWTEFCSIHANADRCASEITGTAIADCSKIANAKRALYEYACSQDYTGYKHVMVYQIRADAASMGPISARSCAPFRTIVVARGCIAVVTANANYVGGSQCLLPTYNGQSNTAQFQCSYYTTRHTCMVTDLAQSCNPDYLVVSLEILALRTAQEALGAGVQDDCPLLQPLKEHISSSDSVHTAVMIGVILAPLMTFGVLVA